MNNPYAGNGQYEDEDNRIPWPDGFEEGPTAAQAMELAYDIKRELAGKVEGVLVDYLTDARRQAQEAMKILVTVDPTDQATIFRLQRLIAPYGFLMGWINDRVDVGRAAEQSGKMQNEENE